MSDSIRVLPDHIANKIAAGEVVERPASVLKELVENALDAGATQVDVDIAAGGRKLVSVADNGRGMSRDNALLSLERHATSKIRDVDDIESIATRGFRGEALAAIASVSRFRLETADQEGCPATEVLVNGGSVQDVRETGAPAGTLIEVRDLFFNVPARRKFMRSHETELTHVRSTFIIQALSCPHIGMSLTVDGREMYRLAPGERTDRIRELFGPEFMEKMVPVSFKSGPLEISGYISRPGVGRADRAEQYVFVNERATSAPVIAYAVREAYRNSLSRDRHPSLVLHVALPPGDVDVNVHPTKREVRFRHSGQVRDAVVDALTQALAGGSGTTQGGAGTASELSGQGDTPAAPSPRPVQMQIDNLPLTPTFHYPRLHTESAPAPSTGDVFAPPAPVTKPAAGSDAAQAEPEVGGESAGSESRAPWAWCRVVGMVAGRFVILETEDGYIVMDPRAAHERVIFERFMSEVAKGSIVSQSLLMPVTLDLQPGDAERVRRFEALLNDLGFGISGFGGDAFVVDALPSAFDVQDVKGLIIDMVQNLESAGTRGAAGRWREESVARAACRAAVQSRDRLRREEIEQLVVDLAATQMPYTSPAGRPTLIFTSIEELKRKFGIV